MRNMHFTFTNFILLLMLLAILFSFIIFFLFFVFIGCKKVNDAALNALANFCPRIEILNLHSCEVNIIIILSYFNVHKLMIYSLTLWIYFLFIFLSFSIVTFFDIFSSRQSLMHRFVIYQCDVQIYVSCVYQNVVN